MSWFTIGTVSVATIALSVSAFATNVVTSVPVGGGHDGGKIELGGGHDGGKIELGGGHDGGKIELAAGGDAGK